MSTGIEDLLREGMERFTVGVRADPALVRHAARRYRRRRLAARGAIAAGTAAAAAAAVAISVLPGPSPAPGAVHATDVAFIVRHVQRALANHDDYLQYTRTAPTFSAGYVGPSPAATGYLYAWSYRGQSRTVTASAAKAGKGRPLDESGTVVVRAAHGMTTTAFVEVVYGRKTWFRECYTGRTPRSDPNSASSWAAQVRRDLSSGTFVVAGHQRVGGVDAIKLVEKSNTPIVSVSGKRFRMPSLTLWVDPTTYLPVRVTTMWFSTLAGKTPLNAPVTQLASIEVLGTDFRWLPPTAANLANLNITIPRGFRQVTPPRSRTCPQGA
jgi:hypothetical protein